MKTKKQERVIPKPQTTAENYDWLAYRLEHLQAVKTGAERIAQEHAANADAYVITADNCSMIYDTDGRRRQFVERDLPRYIFTLKQAREEAETLQMRGSVQPEIVSLADYLQSLVNHADKEAAELEQMRKEATK